MTQYYLLLKMVHIFGAVIFLGNIVVTAFWKTFADISQDWRIIAFSQRLVTYTDICFTAVGAMILAVSGFFLARYYPEYWHITWIVCGVRFFIASALIWVVLLLPLQCKLQKMAGNFKVSQSIPKQYWFYELLWGGLGTVAIILVLVSLYFMVFKPL